MVTSFDRMHAYPIMGHLVWSYSIRSRIVFVRISDGWASDLDEVEDV